jgi:hypothetical protein
LKEISSCRSWVKGNGRFYRVLRDFCDVEHVFWVMREKI